MSPRPVTRARVVRIAAAASLTVLAGALGACGDAGPSAPVPAIPVGTARELIHALAPVSTVNLGFLLVPPADADSLAFQLRSAHRTGQPALRAAAHDQPVEMFTDTLPCPAGGSTIVSGSLDVGTGDGDRILFLDAWRDCAVSIKGLEWRFTGRPHLRTELVTVPGPGEGEETFTGRFTGVVDFVADTLARRCRFDLTATSVTGGPLHVAGTFCGIPAAALPDTMGALRATAPVSGRPAARSSTGRASPARSGSRSPAR